MAITIEVCVDSLDSALDAGPYLRRDDRLEVCSNLIKGGGLTPSFGLVRALLHHMPHTPLMIMIRPRTGSFHYTPSEVEVMLEDIYAFKAVSIAGFVFGCLLEDGTVDVSTTRRLVEAASPLPVTFHRAFDVTPNWKDALDAIASMSGITRILTRNRDNSSGHMATALDGVDELAQLQMAIPKHLIIVAASGVNSISIEEISQFCPLREAHLSSGEVHTPQHPAGDRGKDLGFGHSEWRLNPSKLRKFRIWVDKYSV
ncbi:hypothetical protein CC85DRAFT_268517 [Cutaneotrichosporon oleaginosum]|uniref:Copper homeostasis protein cutC homolog n=1 Tax=Cutaneotrichosporon oleaginosum TaxID=879819 RepID=A0A0J0XY10_9TREE|nr:uncharacterized protein CC85DRAFT_268517 [Cutaneotrichosporon oleaginosum]KLT45937.1 hypothetical protein CC85DRAFT_268517 [Cutaneotrichosporon oleaginosum]TXT06634.1 hypothetical protein COLE_05965 [Cutaneotrichosporon oleaginosum]